VLLPVVACESGRSRGTAGIPTPKPTTKDDRRSGRRPTGGTEPARKRRSGGRSSDRWEKPATAA